VKVFVFLFGYIVCQQKRTLKSEMQNENVNEGVEQSKKRIIEQGTFFGRFCAGRS
jgi:hypothetical protein